MHVYIRWYEGGIPKGTPERIESANAARAAVMSRFPKATFSEWVRTTHEPTASLLVGIDHVVYAWPGQKAPGLSPVADILFPAN